MARSFTSSMFRVARASATARAIRTGRAPRRAANLAKGRAIGKAGGWRALWK